ncbi:MAG TPA: TIGR01777 family oxidoreductase [Anaerolineae bacterium]|nr:TIGR01777 family oxidoreductase [Anaerolineae bacterium]
MRIIITGGSGLIGRGLVDSLTQDGHEVIVLSRTPDSVKNLPKGACAEKWDGKSAQDWGKFVNGADAIVNLAGTTISERWSEDRKREIRESRVNAGKAIVEAVKAAEKKPRVVVQSSAVGYYGPRGAEEITEDSSAGSDFLASVCQDWEASTAELDAMGIRRPIIRTGVVLDKNGGALPKMVLPVKMFVGGPLGSGQQYFPWIHLHDEVVAIRWLIDNSSAHGVYNLSAPQPVTNKEFTHAIGKVLGRPTFMPVPAFAMKTLFGEMATLLLDGQREMPMRLVKEGFKFKFTNAEAALRDVLK